MFRHLALLLPRNWGRLSRAVFGDFKYQPPGWIVSTSGSVLDSMRRGPGVWASIIVLTGLTFVGGYTWHQWWEAHKPRPTPPGPLISRPVSPTKNA